MTVNIHASCVAIAGKGVLILGASGVGKSDLALRLIDEGAREGVRLVADDRCELFVRAGKLCARAPASIAGLLEVRGIGIIALPHAPATRVAMAVRLDTGKQPRLPKPAFYVPPASLIPRGKVPLIVVNAAAPSAGPRIRAALAAFSRRGFRDTFNPE